MKETTITKKADGTWDIQLAPGDEGKCIYVGNIPGEKERGREREGGREGGR